MVDTESFPKMPTHGAELITVEQPTKGPSLNLPRQKSLPLSSQTQCHNSASRPPARRVCLEAFMCVNKCFSVMRFNNHLAGPPDRQDEGSAFFFFFFFSKVSAVWLQCIISGTAFTTSRRCFCFSNERSQWSRRNQTGGAADTQ